MEDKAPLIKFNPIVVIAVFLEAIFIIFVIVTVNNILRQESRSPVIKIDDYAEVSNTTTLEGALGDIDKEDKQIVESSIYEAAALNTTQNIKSFGAKIREDSVHNVYIEDIGTHFINFLADIESLGQTYRVVYRWVENPPDYADLKDIPLSVVYCPKQEELIYGDFNCRDKYNGNAEAQIVYESMRYKMFDNFTVGLIGNPYIGEELTFHLNINSDDEATKNAAISEISDYLSSLGFNFEDYQYSTEQTQ